MQHITVGQLLDNDDAIREPGAYCIYVIRHNSTVFYVGQSTNVIGRLLQHMGLSGHGRGNNTDIGNFINANLPESHQWSIDLLTLDECGQYTPFAVSTIHVNEAEADLIRMLRPCFNRKVNRSYNEHRLDGYELPWRKCPAELWPF